MLVSLNGAEVLVMDRDFYYGLAPPQLRYKLETKLVNGYPTDDELKCMLQHYIDWDVYKKQVIDDLVVDKKNSKDLNH